MIIGYMIGLNFAMIKTLDYLNQTPHSWGFFVGLWINKRLTHCDTIFFGLILWSCKNQNLPYGCNEMYDSVCGYDVVIYTNDFLPKKAGATGWRVGECHRANDFS